ncbi:hypothetical protein [Rhizobium sp. NFACC06-2]|uniref:hypothetical protein n=1 Tax=Rhizobium sp. NFACC06-2 TaxID=1566264 RepID=UPI000877377A|nr:hypothetical protein [Rhizobium sp. NFACC06-2]SCY90799.1 hypothetical protein SAMN03159288_05127 [Rhizobium sp. NFACC06-2]
MRIDALTCLSEPKLAVFKRAWDHSSKLISKANAVVSASLQGSRLDQSQMCVAIVGSTARYEALEASDIDLLPIWSGSAADFPHFVDLTGKVREDLRRQLDVDVSTSRDLMRSTRLADLCKADGIGGDTDHRRTLTQRMLILTESEQLGGGLGIDEVRRRILEAYVGDRDYDRTVSKHPLAVCNDIARYYRTLCVDYKSRAETKPESWAERHAKLRNARKLWYFSTLLALSTQISGLKGKSHSYIFDAMAKTLSLTPALRLQAAVKTDSEEDARKVLTHYADYLTDMSEPAFRESLKDVSFEDRDEPKLSDGTINPYYAMHKRSREMTDAMISMVLNSPDEVRKQVFTWFLL